METENEEYQPVDQAAKDALIKELERGDIMMSYSSLSAFAQSPQAFIAYKLKRKTTTPAMILGEAVHCLVLEPDEFSKRFFIAPPVNAATKVGKLAWAKIYTDFVGEIAEGVTMTKDEIIVSVKQNAGLTVLDAKTYENVVMRAHMLQTNTASKHVLSFIEATELKIETEICDVPIRGLIDGWGPGVIMDIKMMPSAALGKAQHTIFSRHLDWQAYIYDKAKGGGHKCYILAVDPTGEVSVHCFNEQMLRKAETEIENLLFRFKELCFLSQFEPTVWDQSQDFWLKSTLNPYGINYL